MKVCNCPRCFFFVNAANDLLAMGDLEGALLAASEVTVQLDDGTVIHAGEIVPSDGTVEGYAADEAKRTEFSPEVFN